MLAISDGEFGYRRRRRSPSVILRGVSRSVLAGQRIGILGANGQGKSTLVKTIARDIARAGRHHHRRQGPEHRLLRAAGTGRAAPAGHAAGAHGPPGARAGPNSGESGREQDLRNFLGTFNFTGDMVKQAVGTMSGGEKARLVLAMMVWQRPNLLLLDEPTNHLDLATREALVDGAERVRRHGDAGQPRPRAAARGVRRVLAGRRGGMVAPFDGDLDDYQRYLLDEAKRLRELARQESAAAAAPAPAPAPVKRVKQDRPSRSSVNWNRRKSAWLS